jgi:hypothetical protein
MNKTVLFSFERIYKCRTNGQDLLEVIYKVLFFFWLYNIVRSIVE